MKKKADSLLTFALLGLALFGLVMISSVSVFESNNLTFQIEGQKLLREKFADGDTTFESEKEISYLNENTVKAYLTAEEQKIITERASNSYYLWTHLRHLVMGLVIFIVFAKIPYLTWRRFAPIIFGLAIFLLMAVLMMGVEFGGARSWLIIGGFSFQPSEFAKLALILYLSSWLDKREMEVSTFEHGFLPFVFLMGVTAMFLAMQPDYGSLLVTVFIASSIYFVAGANIAHILLGMIMAGFGMVFVVLLKPHVMDRFTSFLEQGNDALGAGYQLANSLVAIGSGGLFGMGFGKSVQKFGYLPEVQSDSIIAAVAEELGFLKILLFLSIFLIIAWRGYKTSEETSERFGKLVATGITSWIIFQAIINIAVNIGLFPITGITLPFISYGGTSLMMLLAASGILVNISSSHKTLVTNENFGMRRRVRRPRVTSTRRRKYTR